MPEDQELDYKLNFIKGADQAPEMAAELDSLTKKVGVDQPEAAGNALKGYKAWLKESSEGVHLLHQPVRLLHVAMGEIALIIEVVRIAWELYKGSQDKVIESTTKERDANMALVESMKAVLDAGGKLTDSQNNLLSSTEKLAASQGALLTAALEKKRDAVSKDIESTKEKLAFEEKLIAAARERQGSDEGQFAAHLKTVQQLREENKEYAELQAQLGAVSAGYKNIESQLAAQKKSAEDAIAAEKKAAEERKKAAADEAHAQAELLNAQIKGNDDAAKGQIKADEEKLRNKKLSVTQIKAVYDDEFSAELSALKKNEALKLQILNDEHDAGLISEKMFLAKKIALQEETDSKEVQLEVETGAKKKAAETASMEATLANIQAVTQATMQAYAQRIAAGDSQQAAAEAAAGAMIKTVADEAAKEIEIKGLAAAADAFQAAGNPYLGAVEAAGVLAWYSTLAAGVGAVGGAISSSMSSSSPKTSPSSAGSGGGSPSGGGGVVVTSPASPTASAPVQGAGGGGDGTISVNVFIGDEVILRVVQKASFEGRLQISAQAITG